MDSTQKELLLMFEIFWRLPKSWKRTQHRDEVVLDGVHFTLNMTVAERKYTRSAIEGTTAQYSVYWSHEYADIDFLGIGI